MRTKMAARLAALVGGPAAAVLLCVAPAHAIADGTPATPGQYPFAGKFTMTHIPKPDGTFYNSAGSGALIAPRFVLTAGHCFHDVNRVRTSGVPLYATTVTFNTVDLSTNAGETRNVVYDWQSPVNDIALVELDAPVTDVAPLAVSPVAPQDGEQLTMAGWGATSDVNAAPGTVLNTGEVAVGEVDQYTIGVHGVYPSSYTSSCLYDSGMPYFIPAGEKTGVLVSVESTGPSCPHDQLETTARADVVFSWIYQHIADDNSQANENNN
jgi:secreted trypsin-like serine protease